MADKMRLSEAIRLGALLGPQCFGQKFSGDATCAIGSALLAIGERDDDVLKKTWPEFHGEESCPPCGCPVTYGFALVSVVHLNDAHRWSRERIADWIETIEAQMAIESNDEQSIEVTI